MKESVEKAPADPAAMRAALQSAGRQEPTQLAGTTGNVEPTPGPIVGAADTSMNSSESNKDTAEGKKKTTSCCRGFGRIRLQKNLPEMWRVRSRPVIVVMNELASLLP